MPRAVVPVFVLYSAVAVLAAAGARVVATKAERTAIAPLTDSSRVAQPLAEPVAEPAVERTDSATAGRLP